VTEFTVEELRFLVKSLSRSYDSIAVKIARMGDGARDEDRDEFVICERLLTGARKQLTALLQPKG
jgi:hypothetical protein